MSAPKELVLTTIEALKALLDDHDRRTKRDPDAVISLSTAAAEVVGIDSGKRYQAAYQRLYKRVRRGALVNRSGDRTVRVRRGDVVR